jgi:hypothetical protein
MKSRVRQLVTMAFVVCMIGFTAAEFWQSRKARAFQHVVDLSNKKFDDLFSTALKDAASVDYKTLNSARSEREAAEYARDQHRRMSDIYEAGFFASLLLFWGATWLMGRASRRQEN